MKQSLIKHEYLFSFCTVLLLLFQPLRAGFEHLEDNLVLANEKTLFVSLGAHCQSAVQLNHVKLRVRAFPFDWVISNSHNGLIHVLKNDFVSFFDAQSVVSDPKRPWIFLNSIYKMEFRHDNEYKAVQSISAQQIAEALKSAQEKYARRVERFRQLGGFSGKVVFIRTAGMADRDYAWYSAEFEPQITAAQATELRNALRAYFPNLNFILVIVNYSKWKASSSIRDVEDVAEFIVKDDNTFDFAGFAPIFDWLKEWQLR